MGMAFSTMARLRPRPKDTGRVPATSVPFHFFEERRSGSTGDGDVAGLRVPSSHPGEAAGLPALDPGLAVLRTGHLFDLPLASLARARFDEGEAMVLLERARAEGLRSRVLTAVWHAGRARAWTARPALEALTRAADPI